MPLWKWEEIQEVLLEEAVILAMPHDINTITWDDIKPTIRHLCVWDGEPELGWFQKAWKSLDMAGLTSYTTDVDRHWVLVRAIALGTMYHDYCELEWDECLDPSSFIGELFWDEMISHVRIGAMAVDGVDPEECDPHSLFETAVVYLIGEVRSSVYNALTKGFGDATLLYVGLKLSRSHDIDQENLEAVAESVIHESGCLIDGRDEAFAYVVCGTMLAKDA